MHFGHLHLARPFFGTVARADGSTELPDRAGAGRLTADDENVTSGWSRNPFRG
jgi:hypothetical protein